MRMLVCFPGIFLLLSLIDPGSLESTQAQRSIDPRFDGSQSTGCCISLVRDVVLDQGSELSPVEVGLSPNDSSLLVASDEGQYYTSANDGDSWKRTTLEAILPSCQGCYPPHPKNQRVRYRIDTSGTDPWAHYLERTTDGGGTWIRMSCRLRSTNVSINIGTVYYCSKDLDTIYGYGGFDAGGAGFSGIYVSHDGGATFAFLRTTHSAVFTISNSDPQVMYTIGDSASVLKSTDGGESWQLVGQNDELRTMGKVSQQLNLIHQIVVDPTDPNIVFLVSRKGIISSLDGGKSWCNLDLGGNLNTSIRSLALSPSDSRVMLAGTSRGLFRSKNRGCTWERIILK